MHNGKWRIIIGYDSYEEWEFPNTKEFKDALDKLLKMKEKYGKEVRE